VMYETKSGEEMLAASNWIKNWSVLENSIDEWRCSASQ
jgi:hypothetical protein